MPPRYEFIQVNGCKTPGCEDFGVSPREGPVLKGRNARRNGDGYKVINIGSADLVCAHCGKSSRLKGNKGILEERQRQSSHPRIETPLRCPDPTCPNHAPNRSGERQSRRFGRTRSGPDRWQCRSCKRTGSIGKPTLRQQKPHLDQTCFSLLVNTSSAMPVVR